LRCAGLGRSDSPAARVPPAARRALLLSSLLRSLRSATSSPHPLNDKSEPNSSKTPPKPLPNSSQTPPKPLPNPSQNPEQKHKALLPAEAADKMQRLYSRDPEALKRQLVEVFKSLNS